MLWEVSIAFPGPLPWRLGWSCPEAKGEVLGTRLETFRFFVGNMRTSKIKFYTIAGFGILDYTPGNPFRAGASYWINVMIF